MPTQPRKGLIVFDPVIPTLFNDASSPSAAAELAKSHLPHAIQPFETPVSQPLRTDPQFEGRRAMIKTSRDAVFPVAAQEMFAESSGVGWDVREFDGGHEVFLTQPEAVAKVVVEVVRGWV